MALQGQLIILEKGTTDSVDSKDIIVERGKSKVVALYPYANLGSDTADLMRVDPDGTTVPVTDANGDVVLSSSRTEVALCEAGTYRLEVTTRTASWGAYTEQM